MVETIYLGVEKEEKERAINALAENDILVHGIYFDPAEMLFKEEANIRIRAYEEINNTTIEEENRKNIESNIINVCTEKYDDIINGEIIQEIVQDSINEIHMINEDDDESEIEE